LIEKGVEEPLIWLKDPKSRSGGRAIDLGRTPKNSKELRVENPEARKAKSIMTID
jgi:hypothetical protein